MAGTSDEPTRRRGEGRVPPHNLDAESSVLGAMLLSQDAIGAVAEYELKPAEFYRPAHQHIFDAIVSLYRVGEPVDTVTVADALRRAGLLEGVGGTEALVTLQNATPAISSAKYYAKIVRDTSTLRRLIRVSGDIAELAYGDPDDVAKAVDEAEQKVYEIGDEQTADTMRPMRELIAQGMDLLEERFANGVSITGAPTGFGDLDELLSGLQPSTLNIVGARPAMGKCVAWDTPMVDVATGEVVTADELMTRAIDRGALTVRSLDRAGRQVDAAVSACLDDGEKPVFTVRTRSGRRVSITASHPLLTTRGWQPLVDIAPGELIAVPAELPVFGDRDLPDAEIDLLALLLGDGCMARSKCSPSLTTASPAVRIAAGAAAEAMGTHLVDAGPAGLATTWRISARGHPGAENPVTACLRRNDMWGRTAHDKRIPAAVFALPRPRLARFLNRLFATDGTAWRARSGVTRIGYSSVSEQLASDVAHLVRRFGIRAKLRQRQIAYAGGRRTAFEVEIIDARSLLRFCDEIGILGKEAAVDRIRDIAASVSPRFTLDCVPAEVWDDIMKAKEGRSWRDINRACGRADGHNWHPYRGRLRRDTVAELADVLDNAQLRWWASPDVEWDRIVSIEPAGTTRVIDFTVPGAHNFVAADIYLHNTAFGLNIAVNVAQVLHQPVLVFSLEMGHDELTQRILSSEARVDSKHIATGNLSESEWAKIGQAIGRLEVPLFLDDNPRLTVMEIRAKARRLKTMHGSLALIVVDYLQLMSSGGSPENRQLEVSEISRSLKVLARELEVPILALSQLSRGLEQRAEKRPMLSDLRESGSLEQDADTVMFLYRDEVYDRESSDRGSAEVIVAKHRSGPIGTCRLTWLGQCTRFGSAARRADI